MAGAEKLRNNMGAAEFKLVVTGLICLKYISDSIEEMRVKLTQSIHAPQAPTP